MEILGSSEMFEPIYVSTRRHPKRPSNFKSCIISHLTRTV